MSSTLPPTSEPHTVSSLIRTISVLEEENARLHCRITNKPGLSLTCEGRAVRWVVTLVEPITDLIAEYDRREIQAAGQQDLSDPEMILPTTEQQRTYRAYEKLIQWCPSVHKVVGPAAKADTAGLEITFACKELQKGADGARADDSATLKIAIAQWLNESQPCPDPPFNSREKNGRGFNHEITGKLLCPVDYDWANADVRTAIREFHPDFRVTAHCWPSFLYADGEYDPAMPAKGLFKGKYLVMAFRCVFTSPGSAQNEVSCGNIPQVSRPSRTRQQSRHHVAKILKMNTVQPRAIAYVATQLRFALSSCSCWMIVDEDFNHEEFYHNIVDYFELPSSPQKAAELNDLLLWWNLKIFGRRSVSHYRPQPVHSLSVSLSRKA
ncbi:hypothetical protein EDD15DRAFT_2374095 [Pisolithus albus]|nr:hypothetical protein EDD15DRAFT_2374095 [Pisolithus albus]